MEKLADHDIHQSLIAAAENYHVPTEALEKVRNHPPTLICGITSAGKDTVAHELLKGGGYEMVISHTTRQPRINNGVLEQDGEHYYFVDESTMLDLAHKKYFFEIKQVHERFYGTSLAALEQPYTHHNTPLLVIDFQGAQEFVSVIPGLRPIFLLPPNLTTWQTRLNGRGEISDEEFHRRLISAEKEIKTALEDPAFQITINYEKDQTAAAINQGYVGRDHDAIDVSEHLLQQIQTRLGKSS